MPPKRKMKSTRPPSRAFLSKALKDAWGVAKSWQADIKRKSKKVLDPTKPADIKKIRYGKNTLRYYDVKGFDDGSNPKMKLRYRHPRKTLKNGAIAEILPSGRYRIVKGASKKYILRNNY